MFNDVTKLHLVIICNLSDKFKRTNPTVFQLAKGSVEEVKFKGHDYCLKITSTLQGEKIICLSFREPAEHDRWFKKCKKVCYQNMILRWMQNGVP